MAKAELGLKRTCVNCGARFYDLNREPPVCPKCDETQPSNLSRLKRRTEDLPDDKKKLAPATENETTLVPATDDDDVIADDDLDEDDDLDDDLDDDIKDIEVTTDKDDHDDH